jgi:soluble lytic murein transglycosylase
MMIGATTNGIAFLLKEYRSSHIMSFAGYNAGRGRVQQWVKERGDPRDPKVDPVDWVERIPFSETRNYVQRVLEGLHVYRTRFDTGRELASSNRGGHSDIAQDGKPGEMN